MTRFRQEAALYESHQVELTRFATALVGPSDAADVVSDAVSSLLRSGKLTEAEKPVALMYRAVLSKARSHQRSFYRRRAREQRFADELVLHDPELRPDVVEAVVRLSPQLKACVYLTYWEDLTPSECSRVQRCERIYCGRGE